MVVTQVDHANLASVISSSLLIQLVFNYIFFFFGNVIQNHLRTVHLSSIHPDIWTIIETSKIMLAGWCRRGSMS